MPITTPVHLIPTYSSDPDHFIHVLEHLFIPSIKKAEYEPIAPIAKGADLIQAEIIQNIESTDLVLCDISCLNPNVFFELGIRTALNKPVCYVKDNHTEKIPFDNSIINHHSYDSNLAPWLLENEIISLSQHILNTMNRSDGTNSLWKYFGLSSVGKPSESKGGVDDRLELMNIKLDSLKNIFENSASIEKSKYLEKQKKEIEQSLAGLAGERAAIIDLLENKENFQSREQYEETLSSMSSIDERRASLLEKLRKIV
jgi:hypothetical protein